MNLALTIQGQPPNANGQPFSAGTLAHFHIGDTTAGHMLLNEGLAKVWEGRRAS